MSSVEDSLEVGAPIDDVFLAVTDPQRAHEWNSNVLGVSDVSPGPMGPGKSWTQTTAILGKHLPLKCTVVRYEPPYMGELEISGGQQGRLTTWCERIGARTRLRQRIEFKPPGGLIGRVGGKVAAPLVHQELKHALRKIQMKLEAEAMEKSGSRTS